jgi:hypothetical protein
VTRGDLPAARQFAAEADGVIANNRDERSGNSMTVLAVAKSGIAMAADDLDEAARLLAGAMRLTGSPMERAGIAAVGERIAVLVARRGDDETAAVLLGAAAGLRGVLDQGEPSVRALVAGLTERLGPERYRTAFQQGFDHDQETAVEHLCNAVRQPV